MIIIFQNILLLKEFLACDGCFGLFTKIIKKSENSFWCTFSAWFFHKYVLYLILHQWTKFQCHTFFQNVLLSSYLNNWWCHRLIIDHPLNQWLTERKRTKIEIQMFEYLENEKSFQDEIKSILHSFCRAIYHSVKK